MTVIRLAWTLLGVLGLPAFAWACPGCKEALFDPGQLSQKLATARAYSLSVGLLLLVPASLILGVAVAVIRASRRRPPGADAGSVDTPTLSR